jgi:hypothetical protein
MSAMMMYKFCALLLPGAFLFSIFMQKTALRFCAGRGE